MTPGRFYLLIALAAVLLGASGSIRPNCCGSVPRVIEEPCFDTPTPTPTGATPTPTQTPTGTLPTSTPTIEACTFHETCDDSALASVSDGSNGQTYVWANPNLAKLIDTASAGGTNLIDNTTSSYLRITNFGGSNITASIGCLSSTGVNGIPDDAVIQGITLLIRGCEVGSINPPDISDETVKLVVGGTVSGANRAKTGGWDSTYNCVHFSGDRRYGGPADLWGLVGLTGADLKGAGFGVALAVKATGGDVAPTVDGVAFTNICYKLAGE